MMNVFNLSEFIIKVWGWVLIAAVITSLAITWFIAFPPMIMSLARIIIRWIKGEKAPADASDERENKKSTKSRGCSEDFLGEESVKKGRSIKLQPAATLDNIEFSPPEQNVAGVATVRVQGEGVKINVENPNAKQIAMVEIGLTNAMMEHRKNSVHERRKKRYVYPKTSRNDKKAFLKPPIIISDEGQF